ncbi:ArsA family ATPase [Streptomyces hoynatensis]|uniref:ArsA family ATPase n=1 Tax=Streptomyces hoynatensis TaxID=1141874 RepID=A0A3A9Z266_9ACTN|nr:ArsA-related P-loop ATPase [Streptomyces hoynatensis]RKN42270.1 ArsA family ATPase [Streptomyces hoynatensis]
MTEGRILFVTGPGGDGTSTVAAATALAAARGGDAVATLLLSTESPTRLAALLGAAPPAWPGPPADVVPGLQAARIDSGRAFRGGMLAAQRWAGPALDALGATALDDDELTELPGAAELAVLRALREAGQAGHWDLIVADLPPATEAIRLLALPEQLRRYLRRLLPRERQTARALRPMLAQLIGVPLPAQSLFEAADRWDGALGVLQELVQGPGAAVRLVAEPTARAAAMLRASLAGLALHGLAVEGLVANRLLPAEGAGPWAAGLAERQRAVLGDLAAAREELPPLAELPHLGRDVDAAGVPRLAALLPPPAPPRRAAPELEDRLRAEGLLLWHLPLPGAVREELGLVRRGDELLVTTGPFRRALALPAALRRCDVTGARLDEGGRLTVRFTPDEARWPARS